MYLLIYVIIYLFAYFFISSFIKISKTTGAVIYLFISIFSRNALRPRHCSLTTVLSAQHGCTPRTQQNTSPCLLQGELQILAPCLFRDWLLDGRRQERGCSMKRFRIVTRIYKRSAALSGESGHSEASPMK